TGKGAIDIGREVDAAFHWIRQQPLRIGLALCCRIPAGETRRMDFGQNGFVSGRVKWHDGDRLVVRLRRHSVPSSRKQLVVPSSPALTPYSSRLSFADMPNRKRSSGK